MKKGCFVFCVVALQLAFWMPLTAGQDCSDTSIRLCLRAFGGLDVDVSVISIDDVIPSWNETVLSQLCLSYKQYSVCMKTVIIHCNLSEQLDHQGLDDAFDFLCYNSSQREEYLSYETCFGRADLRSRIDFCNETLTSKKSTLKNVTTNSERLTHFCHYYDEYVDCMSAAVKEKCGKDANNWHHDYVTKMFKPSLAYLKCPGWGVGTTTEEPESGWSVGSVVIIVFISLTIVLMLVVVIVFAVIVCRRRKQYNEARERRLSRTTASREARGLPPAYSADPYVVYGAPGPDGEGQLRIVGRDGAGASGGRTQAVAGSSSSAFKAVPVQPPPYADQPPPVFGEDSTSRQTGVSTATSNPAFTAEDGTDNSAASRPDNGGESGP